MVIVRKKKITEIGISADWYVEMEENQKQNTIDFWLSHKDYGIKALMFALPIDRTEEDRIAKMIEHLDRIAKPYQKMYIDSFFTE